MLKNIWTYTIILAIALAIIAGQNLQYKLLYYPSSNMPSKESLSAVSMQFWPTSSKDYRGFVGLPDAKRLKGTIIVFHGNEGTAADGVYYVKALTPLGYKVILAEYPGYGTRGGNLGEGSFVSDALETLHLAHQYEGPIILLGESLGCGVVASVAKESAEKIDGIILITPWDTLRSVAKEKVPWIPVRFLMKDRYDTIGNLRGYQGRVAVIAAERDEIIPMVHAITLYNSLSGKKAMWVIKGAGHNDWPMHINDRWWREVVEFVRGDPGRAEH